MKFTFLGTGTSQGVPAIGCDCAVCTSSDPRDRRLRTSGLLTTENGKNIVIDVGPDFRQQMLTAKVTNLHAAIFTHEHTDHMIGIDDLRPFNFHMRCAMPLYAPPPVSAALKQRFDYAFTENPYPGAPVLSLKNIDKNNPFLITEADDLSVLPIEVMHGRMPILGFRINNFAYITDCKTIEYIEFKKLKGVTTLVLNALHHTEHHAHLTLAQAIALAQQVGAARTFFVHQSHRFGKYEDIAPTLPKGCFLAYDGLEIEI